MPDVANPEQAANAIPYEVKEVFCTRYKKSVNGYTGPKPMLDANQNQVVNEDPLRDQIPTLKKKVKTNEDDFLTIQTSLPQNNFFVQPKPTPKNKGVSKSI